MPVLHTIRDPWIKIRDAVADTDTSMTADGAGGSPTKEWASRDTSMGCTVPLAGNGLGVSVMGDVENAQCTLNIYVYKQNGPARFVASVTFTIGGQLCVEDPTTGAQEVSALMYADTIALVDRAWPPDYFELVPDDGGANDEIAGVIFDGRGGHFLKVEVAALDEGLTVTPILEYW